MLPVAIEERLTQGLVLGNRLQNLSLGRYIANGPLSQTRAR